MLLESLSLHEALFAVNRSVSAGLEWDFRLLPALRTNGLVHLSRAEIPALSTEATTGSVAEALSFKWHFLFLLSDSWVVCCFLANVRFNFFAYGSEY